MSDVATKPSGAATSPPGVRDDGSPGSPTSSGAAGVAAQVVRALGDFVAALVHADGGEIYLVSATNDDVHLHLTGTCAGCPGATMTRERLLEPAVHGVLPKANVKVTTGWRVPDGAIAIGGPNSAPVSKSPVSKSPSR